MKNRIGYCGLDCEQCDAYLATVNDDQDLREKNGEVMGRVKPRSDSAGTYSMRGLSRRRRENRILRADV